MKREDWLRVGGRGVQRVVVILAALAGILVAVTDLFVTLKANAPQPRVARKPLAIEELLPALVFFATLIGTAASVGRLLYRCFRADEEAEIMRRGLRYFLVFDLVGGAWLVFGGWPALQNALVLRPSFVVGIVLLVFAAWDGWRLIRRVSPPPARLPPPDWQPPYSAPLTEVLLLARSEAVRYKHDFVGPQHLLIAFARLTDRPVGKMLIDAGVTAEGLRAALAPYLVRSTVALPESELLLNTAASKALESAISVGQACGAEKAESQDLLLMLLADPQGSVVKTLVKLGVDIDRLGESLAALPRSTPS